MSETIKDNRLRQDMKLQLIEESYKDVTTDSMQCRITLLYKPLKKSLEIKTYAKGFVFTRDELIHTEKRIIDHIRRQAAIEVFDKFYTDNFLTPNK